MAAWTRNEVRVDIALAVVMEVAAVELDRAVKADECLRATGFNDRLWRVVASLCADSSVTEDRAALVNAAAFIAEGGRRIDQMVELNRRFARLLAGRAATEGGLAAILARWRAARRSGTKAAFGPWLLDLMADLTTCPSASQPLAA